MKIAIGQEFKNRGRCWKLPLLHFLDTHKERFGGYDAHRVKAFLQRIRSSSFSLFPAFLSENQVLTCEYSMQIMVLVHCRFHFWSFCWSKYEVSTVHVTLLVALMWISQQTWWKLSISFSFLVHFTCVSFLPIVTFFYIVTFMLTFSASGGSFIFLTFHLILL